MYKTLNQHDCKWRPVRLPGTWIRIVLESCWLYWLGRCHVIICCTLFVSQFLPPIVMWERRSSLVWCDVMTCLHAADAGRREGRKARWVVVVVHAGVMTALQPIVRASFTRCRRRLSRFQQQQPTTSESSCYVPVLTWLGCVHHRITARFVCWWTNLIFHRHRVAYISGLPNNAWNTVPVNYTVRGESHWRCMCRSIELKLNLCFVDVVTSSLNDLDYSICFHIFKTYAGIK